MNENRDQAAIDYASSRLPTTDKQSEDGSIVRSIMYNVMKISFASGWDAAMEHIENDG